MTEGVENEAAQSAELPWYRRWFGDEYLELYSHRDQQEADAAVELFARLTGLGAGASVLDLACGAGRHLGPFMARGLQAVGLDLSLSLLRQGAHSIPDAHLVRADMRRLPFADATFQGVASFFTSFGYFDTEEEDRRVLGEARRILKEGGHLLLDFLNAHKVIEGLSPRDEEVVDGRRIVQTRRLIRGGKVVEKVIRIESASGGEPPRSFRERVRLYTAPELEALLVSTDFQPVERMGDYRGAPANSSSPRVIVLARAGASNAGRSGPPSTPRTRTP